MSGPVAHEGAGAAFTETGINMEHVAIIISFDMARPNSIILCNFRHPLSYLSWLI
ncbi:hypothetical protein TUM12370_06810 [Salmonella enterica subsp. enterica serovar Choleraesuis]|nr:hypothetical protein TUM12370_06810 [Salmonella enterica subsp. enterica serovar Choleraesuis]